MEAPHAVTEFPALIELSSQTRHALGDRAVSIIGRSSTADIRLADPFCSRAQARVLRHADGCYLEPLSGQSSTYCDGIHVTAPVRMRHGAVLQFGTSRFCFAEHADLAFPQIDVPANTSSSDNVSLSSTSSTIELPEPHRNSRTRESRPVGVWELPSGMAMSVGRDPRRATICFRDAGLSERHLTIARNADSATVRETGGIAPTFVNGLRISGKAQLQAGDRIEIGSLTLVFDGRTLTAYSRLDNVDLVAHQLTQIARDRETDEPLKILEDVSLAIRPGEFACILGPSGSGKSTLMKLLSARERPSQGNVLLNGEDFHSNFEALKSDVVVVPQQEMLYDALSLEDSLRYTARLRLPDDVTAPELDRRVEEVLETVQLTHRSGTLMRHLSGGQRKRAGLAHEIVANPSLLFLDEVTSGLDEKADRELMTLFRRLADTGKTVVCITHNLANIAELCDLVVILTDGGRLAFVGRPAEALEYFQIERLGDIYPRLAQSTDDRAPSTPAEWARRFERSHYSRRYVRERLQAPATSNSTEARGAVGDWGRRWRVFLHQLPILARRYLTLLLADRSALAIMIAQCLLVAGLLASVFPEVGALTVLPEQAEQSARVLFLAGLSCLWFGCNNASKEIVRERDLLRRERDINLQAGAYLVSKVLLLGTLSLLQATVLWGILDWFLAIPGDGWSQWMVLSALSLAGTGLGLLISTLARTPAAAVTTVPLVLVPQIILGGCLARLSSGWETCASALISNYWGYRALVSTLPGDLKVVLQAEDWATRTAAAGLTIHLTACLAVSWFVLALTHRSRSDRARTAS